MPDRIDLAQLTNTVSEEKPSVSVIVAVKNGAPYLAAALRSILQQTYSPLEVLIVDGQSTDDTEHIAKSFEQVRYIRQENQGIANARNIGLHAARGELIAFLDHDDLWPPDKLSVQVAYLQSHPEIMYTITRVRFFLEQGHPLRSGFKPESFQIGEIGCVASALVARREVFERVGEFNPKLLIGGDVDWFARARDAHIPMAVISQVLLFKRIHSNNLSANVNINKHELLAVIRQSVERKRTTYNLSKRA